MIEFDWEKIGITLLLVTLVIVMLYLSISIPMQTNGTNVTYIPILIPFK